MQSLTKAGQHTSYSDQLQRPSSKILGSRALDRILKREDRLSGLSEWWKKANGLHTVKDFVTGYRGHPAGWGALLMIHGIPEVTGRLRNKVENFAVYSALFLGCAVAALMAPPDKITSCVGGIECEVRKRVFFYCLTLAVVSLMLCIMLAMAFGNALNEAARDCDVFRLFSPAGKGYMATRKCEIAFQAGIASTFVAMLSAVQCDMGWEALIFTFFVLLGAGYIYHDTARALFTSASIVDYWKSGAGGMGDPYDLDSLLESFEQRSRGFQEVEENLFDMECGGIGVDL